MRKSEKWAEGRKERQIDLICGVFTVALIVMTVAFAVGLMMVAIDSLLGPYGISAWELAGELLGELKRLF